MKRIFTIWSCLLFLITAYAQNAPYELPQQGFAERNSVVPSHIFRHSPSNSRSSCQPLQLDYNYYNEAAAALQGLNYNGAFSTGNLRYASELTSYVDTFHKGANTYLFATFDSLAYVYLDANQNQALGYIPLEVTTLSLDSLGMVMGVTGDSTKMANDSMLFIVSKKVGTAITAVNTVVLSGWQGLKTLYAGPLQGYTGYKQIPINQQFNRGEGFSVRVVYLAKDTSSHCYFAYSFPDSCGIPTQPGDPFFGAYPSPFRKSAGWNRIYSSGVGAGTVLQAEDNTWSYTTTNFPSPPPPITCRYLWKQNWGIFPVTTACSDFGVVIQATKLKACPNSAVDLTAFAYGTQSTNINYSWSAINGTMTSSSGDVTSVIMGDSANVTVILSVDDGAGTTADTIIIANQAIRVKFSSPTQTIACGGSGTLIPITSGNQVGRLYLWNPGGATSTTLSVNRSGIYSLTVSNNSGCTATTSVNVIYPGVSNTVSFTHPAGNVCKNTPVTLVNTSTGITGWNATWDMLGNNNVLIQTTDATYTYATAGTFPVTLKMDSAGCNFFSAPQNVRVITCSPNSIGEIAFGNGISILPNPSDGQLSLTVYGVEKNISISVYNINGSEVRVYTETGVPGSYNRNFDFSDLANGTYLMKIQSADKTALKKFVINK